MQALPGQQGGAADRERGRHALPLPVPLPRQEDQGRQGDRRQGPDISIPSYIHCIVSVYPGGCGGHHDQAPGAADQRPAGELLGLVPGQARPPRHLSIRPENQDRHRHQAQLVITCIVPLLNLTLLLSV